MRPTIDAIAFARDGLVTEGVLAPGELARLQESGARCDGARFRVAGQRSVRGKPALLVHVQSVVVLACQRCLEPLDYTVDETVELELCEDQREIDAADDDIDRLLASHSLDVIDLVEDEILLALPMVARHRACEPPGEGESSTEAERSGPWAALSRLKQS